MNQFVESLRRLYQDGKISKEKVVELCEVGKLSEEEKIFILSVN
jgi:hypothetical protein